MAVRKKDLLVEIGTEELPPKSLIDLASAFASGVRQGLDEAGLPHAAVETFATPRRLAVRVRRVGLRQPDREIRRTGPAVAAAFDAAGAPTRAAQGFAASCGSTIEALQQTEGPKGPVLLYVGQLPGRDTVEIVPEIVTRALERLPIARRMRWGAGDVEFVRPVHWVVMLLGSTVVPGTILGVTAGAHTRGHRFHAARDLKVTSPARYEAILRDRGFVIADFAERRERIRAGVAEAADAIGGIAVIDDALLDEVTALVEWPAPLAGRYDDRFLALPPEVPIATMQEHQRYFPVRDRSGALSPWFVAVANIESRDPAQVRAGNERVIRPRLADAAFFWDTDRREPLAARRERLERVTFEARLGSVADKTRRVRALAATIADRIGGDIEFAERTAELCKCDLVTSMVGEFPELQGVMGRYYARLDGEPGEVASAIAEHYQPRYAGDALPQTRSGMAVAIADRLDTIVGIFAIGQKPSGTRDPYGLRRAALGLLRITIEQGLELDLTHLIERAADLVYEDMRRVAAEGGQSIAGGRAVPDPLVADVYDYVFERLRAYYLEGEAGRALTTEMFDAVLANRPASPLDFDARLRALEVFLTLPDAASLAAANKRIANILRKAGEAPRSIDDDRLIDPAERILAEQVAAVERLVAPLREQREYTDTLRKLAVLRPAIDRFFDEVMVMAEDPDLRANRLALLARLAAMFLTVADLSRLPG
jgi:glycyl-tRNA synthetase beta chain